LLADTQTISNILGVELEQFEDLEDLDGTKDVLDKAIAESTYLSEENSNQRPLQIQWKLASQIDLGIIKNFCPNGYAAFTLYLIAAAKLVAELNSNETPNP